MPRPIHVCGRGLGHYSVPLLLAAHHEETWSSRRIIVRVLCVERHDTNPTQTKLPPTATSLLLGQYEAGELEGVVHAQEVRKYYLTKR